MYIMSKKLNNLKWDSVALEGFSASVTSNLHGFVGLEECTSYGLDKEKKKSKKKRPEKKRKATTAGDNTISNKKVKLSNGFTVETCSTETPSLTNCMPILLTNYVSNKKNNKKQKKSSKTEIHKDDRITNNVETKKKILKLGEDISETASDLTPEDMLTWAEFKLPESILKALTELGFKKPTTIQQLTLPAAIHGRRDILGAAETGSGKTLAFGLPILTGIMKLKEKADAGLDVYEIPYKKTSNKKKITETVPKQKRNKKSKKSKSNAKESSEDGYGSGEESNDDKENSNQKSDNDNSDDEYLEEINVPVRKKGISHEDEGNDSDGSDDNNYVHLSDMLDSDDLDDSSEDDDAADDNQSDNEIDQGNEYNIDEGGIGCVKVIDNIDIPGQETIKTLKPLYALILTPTRELAIQISRHLMAAAKYTGIRVATIVGGMAAVKQERVLRQGPEVVVATPGRLWELVTQGHIQNLHAVKFLAIDETDRMIETGHFEELQPLLERLNADDEKRSSRQNFVFSATLTMVHELPAHLKGKKVTKRGKILNRKVEKMTPQQKIKRLVTMIGMTDPKVVDITAQNLGTAETLTESRIACSLEHKDAYLYYILKRHPGRTIVFCNSIGSVRRLTQIFTILKCRPLPLHASMPQRQRLKNLERFRDDPCGVLVATDVAARGLDVPDVDHVLHYQVPRTAENYVHRSGRTARASKEGLTVLMMEPAEAFLYSKLCRTLNKTSDLPLFPVAPSSLAPLKELVSLARDIDALELKRRRTAQANGWKEKAAREMDMIIDDDDIPSKQSDPTLEKALRAKKRDLDRALARPLFPAGFSFKYPTLNDPDALTVNTGDKALEVMKRAIQSGELKKEKRNSKNAPLLKLGKTLKKNNKIRKSKAK